MVEVRTDLPEVRFAAGSLLHTEPVERGPLIVESARVHSGRLLVRFAGATERGAAESLAGTLLLIDAADRGDAGHEAWWDEELIGLRVVTVGGDEVGAVGEVIHVPLQDLLVVVRPSGGDVLVPLVAAIVVEVDIAAGRILLDPPDGLLEMAERPGG